MKFELDLVREPTPEGFSEVKPSRIPSTDARREVRVITDALIHEGLRANEFPPLIEGCCDAMLTLARQLLKHDLNPDVPDFIEAATALIEDARTVFDAGMRVDDPERSKIGAVMLEITIRGVFAALSLDYEALMNARFTTLKEIDRVRSQE